MAMRDLQVWLCSAVLLLAAAACEGAAGGNGPTDAGAAAIAEDGKTPGDGAALGEAAGPSSSAPSDAADSGGVTVRRSAEEPDAANDSAAPTTPDARVSSPDAAADGEAGIDTPSDAAADAEVGSDADGCPGACSLEDQAMLMADRTAIADRAQSCSSKCMEKSNPSICVETCMEEDSSVSGACGVCFVGLYHCAVEKCLQTCVSSRSEAVCDLCFEQKCNGAYEACAGLGPNSCNLGVGLGAPCDDATDCEPGLVCTVDGTTRCTVPSGIGAPCAADDQCGDLVCRPLLSPGVWAPWCGDFPLACNKPSGFGVCSVDGACPPHHACHERSPGCFGFCKDAGVEGGPCVGPNKLSEDCWPNDLVCNKALAPGGICAKPGQVGTPCISAKDCAVELPCVGASGVATCQPPVPEGGACSATTDCGMDLQCDRPDGAAGGVCRVPAPPGAPCASPFACGEGLTCLPGPDGPVCALGDKPCEGDWCPASFVCTPGAGGTKWCSALYLSCAFESCPAGYDCRATPGGLDGSCWIETSMCIDGWPDTWDCGTSCDPNKVCTGLGSCSAYVYGGVSTLCKQCQPAPGTRQEGAPCLVAADCASTLACAEGACAAVPIAAPCGSGYWGTGCAKDQRCAEGVCKPALGPTAPCTSSPECGAGKVCRSPGPACLPPLTEGELCQGESCASGLTCGSTGVCIAPAQFLEPCVTSDDCTSGFQCNLSMCTWWGSDYGPCNGPLDCYKGECVSGGYCAPSCITDQDCLPPTRCLGNGAHLCRLPEPSGSECTLDKECASNHCAGVTECSAGKCD